MKTIALRSASLMYKPIRTSLLIAALFASAAELANVIAMEAPKVPAELGEVSFLVGDWNCTRAAPRDSANHRPGMSATLQARTAVGGHWIHVAYDSNSIHVAGYIGFNAKRRQYVQSMVDSYGDYWNGSSQGWNGDTLTFDDPSTDPGGPSYRDTYIKRGTDEFLHTGEVQDHDGKWMKTDEQSCRRKK